MSEQTVRVGPFPNWDYFITFKQEMCVCVFDKCYKNFS